MSSPHHQDLSHNNLMDAGQSVRAAAQTGEAAGASTADAAAAAAALAFTAADAIAT
jgi:hypothetical protein